MIPFSPIPMTDAQRRALSTLLRTYAPADDVRVCLIPRTEIAYLFVALPRTQIYLEILPSGHVRHVCDLGGWIAIYLMIR